MNPQLLFAFGFVTGALATFLFFLWFGITHGTK